MMENFISYGAQVDRNAPHDAVNRGNTNSINILPDRGRDPNVDSLSNVLF